MKRDLSGETFGRLKVLRKDESRRDRSFWICQCSCGKLKSIYRNHLLTGSSRSCGCLRKEEFSERLRKHGKANTKFYRVWQGMIERCYYEKHKSYAYYGGRGVTVCEEWKNLETGFKNFSTWSDKNNYETGLTLDRIDNNGNYCPENCRWVTRSVQMKNTRRSKIYKEL